ncbi:MAG: hypothetical protein K2L49_08160, partial [Muribaculaceae bacterium]|nr:hypothetical protein [Muribaculaceae bacterium]
VYLFNEVGSAGVYPGPGIRRRSVENFQAKLKELEIDAVISGNGGCGLCTPKETGSSIAAEYIGIPAVTIAAPGFSDQVSATAVNNGIPIPRVAVYPGAFSSHSEQQLIENTRNILWPQIKDALTRPLSPSENIEPGHRIAVDPLTPVFTGTVDEVNRYFNDMNWSDGLPIIPPTKDRINEFLKFGNVEASTTIATLPIAHRNTQAAHIAACGVMAGCRPEYMPILIALTKALGAPEFRRTLSSTHAWNPYCWINGPVARQLGIDCGQGEISETANMVIGRFINLALKNLSGYYIKQDRMGTFGYLMPWCIVEDEQACNRIGWSPYHVQQGYSLNDNTITMASALMWGNNMAPSTQDPQKISELIAWDITQRCQFALGSGKQYTYRTILLTEPVAKLLQQQFDDKAALESSLINTARRPLHERAFANYYANPGSRKDNDKFQFSRYKRRLSRTECAELTPIPKWYALPEVDDKAEIMTIPVMKPGMTSILVTGDNVRNKIQTMPGGGYSTIPIELPDNWDELMQELGYPPLKDFFLDSY